MRVCSSSLFFLAISVILLQGCNKTVKQKNVDNAKDSQKVVVNENKKVEGNSEDTGCVDSLLITSGKIGCFYLGSSIGQMKQKVNEYTETVFFEEDVKMIRLIGKLNSSETIQAEANYNTKIITALRTNSKKYVTKSGLRVGDSLEKIKSKGLAMEVVSDVGGLVLGLKNEKIKFLVDKESLEKYYDAGGNFPESLEMSSTIDLIGVGNIY